jgi:hypothetical protein
MINNVPSAPFSMSLIPPLGRANPQLALALKRLSAAKYGKVRADAERDIFQRLRAGDAAREAKKKALTVPQSNPSSSGSSFLDEWLAKRRQMQAQPPKPKSAAPPVQKPTQPPKPVKQAPKVDVPQPETPMNDKTPDVQYRSSRQTSDSSQLDTLQVKKVNQALQDAQNQDLDEIYIDLRGQLHHKSEEELASSASSTTTPVSPKQTPEQPQNAQQPPQPQAPATPGAPLPPAPK